MSEYVNTGSVANDGTGDTLRQAFTAVNRKITELALFPRGEWEPSAAYTVTPRREWVIESDTAYAATVNHTSGSTFATDLAAGKWLPMDSAQLIADLAAATGSSVVGCKTFLTAQSQCRVTPRCVPTLAAHPVYASQRLGCMVIFGVMTPTPRVQTTAEQ